MISELKQFFSKRPKSQPPIIIGERDAEGWANVTCEGQKAQVRLYLWDEEDVKRLQQIAIDLQSENK